CIGYPTSQNEVSQEIAPTLNQMNNQIENATKDSKLPTINKPGIIPIHITRNEAPAAKPNEHSASRHTEITYVKKCYQSQGEDCDAGRKEARGHLLNMLAKAGGSTAMRPWAGLSVGVMERALKDAGEPQSGDAKEVLRNSLKDAKSPDQVGAYAIGVGIAQDT